MNLDRQILSAVLREKEAARQERQRVAALRREELLAAIPELAEIDRKMRGTAAGAICAAFEHNEDPELAILKLREENLKLQARRGEVLTNHGFPENYLSETPECPACGDTGYTGPALCQCVLTRYAQLLTQRLSSILPIADQNFESFCFDYYSDKPDARFHDSPRAIIEYNFAECRDYAAQFGGKARNLLLFGSAGLGKTFLSTCIARVVSERGYSVCYDTAITILGNFEKEKFGGPDSEQSQAAIKRYWQADLLIVDDLGMEMSTAFTVSALYNLLNQRLLGKKPMIFNTNLQPTDLQKRYNPAVSSRILGEFTCLRFLGEDIRQLKKQRMG